MTATRTKIVLPKVEPFFPPELADAARRVDKVLSQLAHDASVINADGVASLAAHLADHANPHVVTKAQVGLSLVENTALSTWAGTINITTLGTVGTGTWQGTPVAAAYLGAHTHAATNVVSGTFADARIAQSNVTQHQAALAIAYSQLTGVVPTWNQNTTGSAAKLTTARTIWGQSFDGSANVSGALSGATTGAFSGAVTTGALTATGNVLAGTDATYDFGASGASRFRDAYLSRDFYQVQGSKHYRDGPGGDTYVYSPSVSGIDAMDFVVNGFGALRLTNGGGARGVCDVQCGTSYTMTTGARRFVIGGESDLITVTNNTGGIGNIIGFMSAQMALTGSGTFTNTRILHFTLTSSMTGTASSGNVLRGAVIECTLGSAAARAGEITGTRFDVSTGSATGGTVATMTGADVFMTTGAAGVVVTNARGLWIRDLSNAGTFTNTYAIYVGDITTGTQTNQAYSLYLSDANARSYSAGPFTIDGTLTIASSLTGILRADAGVVSVAVGVGAKSLFDHFADASNGTTVETDLYSDTIAASQLGGNGQKLSAQYGGTFVGDGTSTQRIRAYFGGTLIFDTGALGVGVTASSWDMWITVVRETSTTVRVSVSFTSALGTFAADATYTKITGLTLTNTQVLKVTGTAAGVTGGSNQITASEGFVQWIPAA